MAYRYDKNPNTGKQELVIDGWENGIADSPYAGIANIRNINIRYYGGVAYVNYKRKAATISGGTMAKPMFSCTSPAGVIYILDSSQQVWQQSAVNSTTFNLITGNPSTGGSGQGIAFWNNYLFVWRASAIDICGDGTGDSGVTSSHWNNNATTHNAVWPIGTPTNVLITGSLSAGATTATLSTYNDTNGSAQTNWVLPTGVYQLITSNNELVDASLTFGSTAIAFAKPLNGTSSTSVTIRAIFGSSRNNIVPQHMSIISANDGNLYFCNGQFVGSLSVTSGYAFQLNQPTTYSFNYSALPLPQYETAIWLAELSGSMLIAGVNKLYTWDFVSLTVNSFIPIVENITRMINILNNIYIFAGNKGSIYLSNGYSISPLKKIPDYLTSLGGTSGNSNSLIDPVWTIGGIMTHRQKLYFQAFAQDSNTDNGIFAGILSLSLVNATSSITFDTAGSIVVENQNSFGIVTGSTTAEGLLIDQPAAISGSVQGNDSYFSAWHDTNGGVDFNDTTPYSAGEAFIETDIIPIGTALEQKTFSNIEFKLDQPMRSGDSISVYARQSLSDSYVLVGATATTVLSFPYTPLNFENFQWVQFQIVLTCAASAANTSFMRLREIRIR